MDLNKFAETYSKLEEKAFEIMIIYGIGNYDLDGIEVEDLISFVNGNNHLHEDDTWFIVTLTETALKQIR